MLNAMLLLVMLDRISLHLLGQKMLARFMDGISLHSLGQRKCWPGSWTELVYTHLDKENAGQVHGRN